MFEWAGASARARGPPESWGRLVGHTGRAAPARRLRLGRAYGLVLQDGRAPHEPLVLALDGQHRGRVHRGVVVPDHEVADLPAVAVAEGRRRGVRR